MLIKEYFKMYNEDRPLEYSMSNAWYAANKQSGDRAAGTLHITFFSAMTSFRIHSYMLFCQETCVDVLDVKQLQHQP